jgi:hypothetical protein
MNAQQRAVLAVGVFLLASVSVGAAVTGGEPVSGGVPLQPNSGPAITVDGHGGDLELSTPFNESGTLYLSQVTDKRNASFSGSGAATADLNTLGGTYVNISSLAVSGDTLEVDAENAPQFDVGGDTDRVAVRRGLALDDGKTDLVYQGASGSTDLTLRGLPANTYVAVKDSSTTLALKQTDGSGTLTLTGLPNSKHVVRLTSASPPALSNLGPSGDTTQEPTSLSVDLNDADFSGDSVDVTLTLDGQQVSTQTVSSNQTVTASMPSRGLTGGSHTFAVSATDDAGLTASASTTYRVPQNVSLFNESAPSQQINSGSATVRFFGPDGQVFERSTSSGTLSLEGLPVTEEMVINVNAPNYQARTTYIETIYQQQRAYLLPTNATTSTVLFELDDKTGKFSATGTTLRVEKAITRDFDGDGSNETEFETVTGDRFGAAGEVSTELVTNRRYRLVVENSNDEQRALGGYRVTGDDRVPLEIGAIQFGAGEQQQGTVFQSALEGQAQDSNRKVVVRYADPENLTSQLQYEVVRPDGTVLQSNTTVNGPLGTFKTTIPVPASAPDEVSYEVRYHVDRDEQEDVGGLRRVGDVPEIATTLGLDPTVLAYMSFIMLVAITGLVVVFDDRLAALTAVVVATLLTTLGAISIPAPALGIAGVIALLYNVARG